jgi:hypothetical protein
MASAREELEQLIRHKEDELRALKLALRSLERRDTQSGRGGRFIDMRPIDAIRIVLKEHGGKLGREALMERLIAGGITVGKKRSHHNIDISIELNLRIGNLAEVEGLIVDMQKVPATR